MLTLPSEVINQILFRLRFEEVILHASRVSKQFYIYARSNFVWQSIFDRDYPFLLQPEVSDKEDYVHIQYKKVYQLYGEIAEDIRQKYHWVKTSSGVNDQSQ